MKTKLLVMALLLVAGTAPGYGQLAEEAREAFEQRFVKSKSHAAKKFEIKKLGTVLMTVRSGIPANFDRRLSQRLMPVRPDDPGRGPATTAVHWARAKIRNDKLSAKALSDVTLPAGELLAIIDINYEPNRIEFLLRTLKEHQPPAAPTSGMELLSGKGLASVKVSFYLDGGMIKSGNLAEIYAAIEKWFRPYTSLGEAERARAEAR